MVRSLVLLNTPQLEALSQETSLDHDQICCYSPLIVASQLKSCTPLYINHFQHISPKPLISDYRYYLLWNPRLERCHGKYLYEVLNMCDAEINHYVSISSSIRFLIRPKSPSRISSSAFAPLQTVRETVLSSHSDAKFH